MEAFYQTVAGFCFTIMGLWTGVVQLRRKEWLFDTVRRRMAHSVYLSFALPAAMSLAAAAAPDVRLVWQVTFASAGLFGVAATALFMTQPSVPEFTWLIRRARPLVLALYIGVTVVAIAPDVALLLAPGLKPLQLEALMLSALVFLGAATAWEFSMEPTTDEIRK